MDAIITVDCGFGDSGKGTVVDYLTRELNSDLTVRYSGGYQASHAVCLPSGARHCFHQFGSGTFAGADTYIGPKVIISTAHLMEEAIALRHLGITHPLSRITVHPKALVATPFAQLMNKIGETLRGNDKHGSCCAGIGFTRKYWLDHGSDAIMAKDLNNYGVLTDKLDLLRERCLLMLDDKSVVDNISVVLKDIDDIYNADIKFIANKMMGVLFDVQEVNLRKNNPVIFEGAQGILLDAHYGFHPYTTWSTTTSRHAIEMLEEYGITDYKVLGIVRSHMTRHGAGPLPTEDSTITLKDDNNPTNEWQGEFRFGYLDLPLIEYAIKCDGNIDGLFVTHMDNTLNKIAIQYTLNCFGAIPLPTYQSLITEKFLIKRAVPIYINDKEPIPHLNRICKVVGLSNGPTHLHKDIIDEAFFSRFR